MAKKKPKRPAKSAAERIAEEIRTIKYPWVLVDNKEFRFIWSLACEAAAMKFEQLTKGKL